MAKDKSDKEENAMTKRGIVEKCAFTRTVETKWLGFPRDF